MLACSRCGAARGYLREKEIKVFHQSDDSIPSFLFCNLNRIIDRFEGNHIILSPTSALIYDSKSERAKLSNLDLKPSILIFITHSPYGSEWTFGGISFSIACANHEIPTDVVFIEDGVLLMTGEHKVHEGEGIFNVQEIIEATHDIKNLNFFVYEPSLEMRGIKTGIEIEGLNMIKSSHLTKVFLKNQEKRESQNLKRIIFF
ncbi:MAG: DsrE family protein [Candidatus Helarchaeota archaeon]